MWWEWVAEWGECIEKLNLKVRKYIYIFVKYFFNLNL